MTMHTNKKSRLIKFECDGCGEVLDPETTSFLDATETQDNAGWRYRKVNGNQVHHCPDCGPITS